MKRVQLKMMYNVYRRGGLWMIRIRKRLSFDAVAGSTWEPHGPAHGPFTDIPAAFNWIERDLDWRHIARVRKEQAKTPVTSRAEGGRFHGADC